jgi:aldehyde dehydrogenase family protein
LGKVFCRKGRYFRQRFRGRLLAKAAVGQIKTGALLAGGEGRPDGLDGWFVRPTLFTNVRNDMTIAREEVFGPVLSIIPYAEDEEAIAIGNDAVYGVQVYVLSGDMARARRVAGRIVAGRVLINTLAHEPLAPWRFQSNPASAANTATSGWRRFLSQNPCSARTPPETPNRQQCQRWHQQLCRWATPDGPSSGGAAAARRECLLALPDATETPRRSPFKAARCTSSGYWLASVRVQKRTCRLRER